MEKSKTVDVKAMSKHITSLDDFIDLFDWLVAVDLGEETMLVLRESI